MRTFEFIEMIVFGVIVPFLIFVALPFGLAALVGYLAGAR